MSHFIVGGGKVGSMIAQLLQSVSIPLSGIATHSEASAEQLKASGYAEVFHGEMTTLPEEVSVVWITVPDDRIATVAESLDSRIPDIKKMMLIHCSGATSSQVLRVACPQAKYVLSAHPLQAFAGKPHDLQQALQAHWFLSGDEAGVHHIGALIKQAGAIAHHLADDDRVAYHTAAVIASNGLVALAGWAEQVMPGKQLTPLIPLMQGTLNNLREKGVVESLTGPVPRGDAGVVSRHLDLLKESHEELVAPYVQFSRALVDHTQRSANPLPASEKKALDAVLKNSN